MKQDELNQLTQEEKRHRILYAMGWWHVEPDENGIIMAVDPQGVMRASTPDPTVDLNAMHEAEQIVLTDLNREDYCGQLAYICESDFRKIGVKAGRNPMFSTALQRATAFILTIH